MSALNSSHITKFLVLSLMGGLIYTVSDGIRVNLGIIIEPLSQSSGLSYATLSFILASGQFIYGLSQPFFGILALKRSYQYVLVLGTLMMATGLIGSAYAHNAFLMFIFLSLLFFGSTGALCFGLVLSCMLPLFDKKQALVFTGILNTAAGVGCAFFSPVYSFLLEGFSVSVTLLLLTLPVWILLPISIFLGRLNKTHAPLKEELIKLNIVKTLKEAISDHSYQIMLISFAICGFHMGIIYTHLFTQFTSQGLSNKEATFAFTMFGSAVIAGCFLCGVACVKYRSSKILSTIYLSRALIVGFYIFCMPKNEYSALFFAITLGLTCDATVAPTSLNVSEHFGGEKLALLFGIVYISHQLGVFISAALGGYFIDCLNNYDLIWVLDILLCLSASLLCLSLNIHRRAIKQQNLSI